MNATLGWQLTRWFRHAPHQGYLDMPLFAALILLSIAGIAIYGVLSLVSYLLLRRWHDSARAPDG